MAKVQDVSPNDLIEEVAKVLKTKFEAPSWSGYVKTGAHKERPPLDKDWWWTRAAAVLRSVQLRGPIGVSKLRTKYGGKRNRGVAPERFYEGSGKVARLVLQQLEEAGLVKKEAIGVHKGRVVTDEGRKLLETKATEIFKKGLSPKPKKESKKPEEDADKKTKGEANKDKPKEDPKVKSKADDAAKDKSRPESNEDRKADKPKKEPKEAQEPDSKDKASEKDKAETAAK